MTVIQDLANKITSARDAYWRSASVISDREYDALLEKLKKLDPNHPLLTSIESETVASNGAIQHVRRMYSLGKVYTWEDLVKWAESVARNEDELFLIQPKYDGMSIELVLDPRSGSRLVTRGNGIVGNDVTDHAVLMSYADTVDVDTSDTPALVCHSVVDMLSDPARTDVKVRTCELVVVKKVFDGYRDKLTAVPYKTRRNMASGILNTQMTPSLDKFGPLCVLVDHDAYSIPVTLKDLRKHARDYESDVMGFCGIATDGTVFKLADRKYSESLGYTEHHPRGQIALKMTMREAEAVVKNIVWQVGEQHVSPVCEFDPVELDGVSISRASAHCAQFVNENNLCIGSTVTIIRQGGVIPKVIDVDTPDGLKASVPVTCPDCGQPLKEDGAFVSCTNDTCPSRIAAKIVRGLNILGLKGVGPSLARLAVGELMVANIMEWCTELLDWKNDPVRFSKERLENQRVFTAAQISTLMRVTDLMTAGATASTLLKSVCIPKVGDMFVSSVNAYAGGVLKLMESKSVEAMCSRLRGKPGINDDALGRFFEWCTDHWMDFVDYMKLFKIVPEPVTQHTTSVKGTICMTGSGPKPRDELRRMAEQYGWLTTDNVNQCDVLVCSDPSSKSSKMKKARERGKTIKSYEEFFNL